MDRETIKSNLEIYEAFRSYVRHEDGLINNRMTWMLTIHGFLYATYGFTLQKKFEILEKVNASLRAFDPSVEFSVYMSANGLWYVLLQLEGMLWLIALVGVCISASALSSIRAAEQASENLRYVFERQFTVFAIKRGTGTIIPWPKLTIIFGRFGKKLAQRRIIKKYIQKVAALLPDDSLHIPSIAGGGNDFAMKRGITAAVAIPICLLSSWILAMAFSAGYLWINSHVFFGKSLYLFWRASGIEA